MDIYIYYAVRNEDAALARRQVAQLQQHLASSYDIAPQLKRRPEQPDGLQTWMEVYPDVPADFASVIEHCAAETGVTELVQGNRHVEHFMDVPPCA